VGNPFYNVVEHKMEGEKNLGLQGRAGRSRAGVTRTKAVESKPATTIGVALVTRFKPGMENKLV